MPADKSLFIYGSLYHRLLDPPLAAVRRVAVDLVPEGSSVIDIGCGTGQLCFDLHEKKRCKVLGADHSLRMLDFARAANTSADVSFLHADATDLAGVGDGAFDWATVLLLVHELPLEQRVRVVREASRVAGTVLIIDAAAPLPYLPQGLGIRLVEYTIGHDHVRHFRDFLTRGGVAGLLEESGSAVSVTTRLLFLQKCREAVVVRPER
jgi:ubiquinone/menaquinone biosynthesis C-methylase UbiE